MQVAQLKTPDEADYDELIAVVRADLRDEYLQDHATPWIVGYSGGKDSTLVLHLCFEMLLSLPPSRRRREIHVVANDTLVESPLVVSHIRNSLAKIQSAADVLDLPIKTAVTTPEANQSFWVNIIGRGYPSPNRTFRWCTDRMKIMPTSKYIRERVNDAGQVILLLGVRRSESAVRSGTVAKYDNGERLNKHNDLAGCLVYRPIVELSTDDVWEYLSAHQPPWGGTHGHLIKLYRDASGGECPIVTQKADAPSCGTNSSRFGCWTCTVVDKDRSLEGFVEAGFTEFGPLLDFRDWLITIRNDPQRRLARRRNGRVTITDTGVFIPGPFTMATRTEILEKLLSLQEEVGIDLISKEELNLIKQIWAEDVAEISVNQSF